MWHLIFSTKQVSLFFIFLRSLGQLHMRRKEDELTVHRDTWPRFDQDTKLTTSHRSWTQATDLTAGHKSWPEATGVDPNNKVDNRLQIWPQTIDLTASCRIDHKSRELTTDHRVDHRPQELTTRWLFDQCWFFLLFSLVLTSVLTGIWLGLTGNWTWILAWISKQIVDL